MPARGDGRKTVVYVVDRDASVRSGLCRLALSAGFEARPFASVDHFVAARWPDDDACVILDSSQLAGGTKLKDAMRKRGVDWPVIVLCARDGPLARHDARVAGARFFLHKPVDAQALLDAIAWVTEGEA